MTGLARKIRMIIETEGPIPFDRYMQLCLGDPDFGYYLTRDPFGADGDFTTAPEISQMFGELIGLWAAETWSRHKISGPVRLVELGPGRGTLMADALRACRVAPDFLAAIEEICLVETSPILREKQELKLQGRGVKIRWCDEIADIPPGRHLHRQRVFSTRCRFATSSALKKAGVKSWSASMSRASSSRASPQSRSLLFAPMRPWARSSKSARQPTNWPPRSPPA